MTDPFEELGESLTPKWKKIAETKAAAKEARRAAKPPMVKRGLEKEQEEKAKQMIRYRRWKAEVREGISRGDYGTEIVGLFKLLRKPTFANGLVDYVRNADWLHRCNLDVRLTLLDYIFQAVILHRLRNGYPPFDDAIPAFDDSFVMEPTDDPSCEIRKLLIGV